MEARSPSNKKKNVSSGFFMLHTPHSLSFNSFAASSLNHISPPRPYTLWLQSPALGECCSHLSIHVGSESASFPSDLLWHLQDWLLEKVLPDSFLPFTHPSLHTSFYGGMAQQFAGSYPRLICYYWKRWVCWRTLIP